MTLCIIQARTGSARFPNKSFADLHGKPVIAHVIDKARQIQGVTHWALAVPFSDVAVFSALGIPVYGFDGVADWDVLTRFARTLERYPNHPTVLRLTGDCPRLNPVVADQVLALYHRSTSALYASNVAPGYVDGEDVEVFSTSALRFAHREATDVYDREHVTPFIRRHCQTVTLEPAEDRGFLKTSIDTEADLLRVRAMTHE